MQHGGNPLRAAWAANRQTIGTWCSLPALGAVEVVSQSGFDWVIIDWQHGQFDVESLGLMIQTAAMAGTVPLARVPINEPWMIQKVFDLGAFGVIVPLVDTAEQAAAAVAACRYPPYGNRSFGPIRTARVIGWEPAQANAEVLCIVQVETKESLANVEAIAAVPGVDGIFVGPADLAISMGVPFGDPQVDASLSAVLAAGAANGVTIGRNCDAPSDARAAFAAGFSFVGVGGDTEFLGLAASTAARESLPVGADRGHYPDNVIRAVVSSAPDAP